MPIPKFEAVVEDYVRAGKFEPVLMPSEALNPNLRFSSRSRWIRRPVDAVLAELRSRRQKLPVRFGARAGRERHQPRV